MDLPSWVGAQEKLSYQGDFQCYQGRSMDNRVAFFLFHDEEAKEQCYQGVRWATTNLVKTQRH